MITSLTPYNSAGHLECSGSLGSMQSSPAVLSSSAPTELSMERMSQSQSHGGRVNVQAMCLIL